MSDTPKPRSQERGKRRGYACGRWKKDKIALRIFKGTQHSHWYATFLIPGEMNGSVHLSAIPLLTGLFLRAPDTTPKGKAT